MSAADEFEELPAREPAWAVLDRVTAYRKQLLAAGYWPVPVNGKKVLLDDWVNARATPTIIDTWALTRADHLSTGVLCFNVPFVDIDVTVEEVAEEIEALFEREIENSAVRVGLPPKRAIPFRADTPFRKIAAKFKDQNGTVHKVEILGDGQQIVVNGIHPDTHAPYRWHGGEPGPKLRREDLPLITAEMAAGFIAAAANIMRAHGWEEIDAPKSNGAGKSDRATGASHNERASMRERTYASAALEGCAEDLAATPRGDRNNILYKKAFRIGTMVARNWIARAEAEAALFEGAEACGLVADDGEGPTRKTIASGLDDGVTVPHDPLGSEEQKNDDDEKWEDAGTHDGAPRFKLVPFSDLHPGTEPPYLVDGLIPRTGIAVVWGPPKCGKSFWTFDLCMHVALDQPYRDRRVEAGTVVYAAFEGATGFKKRAEAYRLHHRPTRNPAFYLIAARADLAKDHVRLVADIRVQLGDVRPAAMVLDTLNRSLTGSESKDEDMTAYIRGADAIREAFDCVVVIVHHCGVNDTRPRGHTSLTGAVDAQLAVSRDGAGNIVVLVEWLKDGAEGEQVVSKLETVTVGTDQTGNALTSCVVVPSEITAGGSRLTPNQQTMFSILHDAGERGLTASEWHDRAREAGIGVRRKADLFDIRSALLAKRLIRQTATGWAVNHQ